MTSISALNLIDGVWQPAQSGRMVPSIDPSNGSVLGGYAASGRVDAEVAVAAARRAFDRPEWAQNARLRQMVMLRWAELMESRGERLAQLLTAENGKPLGQSRGEIVGSVSEIRYYAGLTRYIPGHVLEVEPGSFSTLLKEPAGVAGLIIPWNAPAVLLIRALTPRARRRMHRCHQARAADRLGHRGDHQESSRRRRPAERRRQFAV
jgi:acyl-CoA reductase-like NAD-dependent aldehyde dehydrogenase